ncbi:MAG: hypothetical protein ACOWWM_06155 [Desulfobacterales bacterium]
MIDGNQTGHFKFGAPDDEEASRGFDDGLIEFRLRKINRRITLQALLLPVLTALMIVFGYLEIEKRLDRRETMGLDGIESLTRQVNQRLDEVSGRIDGFDQKMTELQAQTTASVKEFDQKGAAALKAMEQELDGIRKSVKGIDVSGVVEKEQQALMASVSETLKPIGQRIEVLSENLKNLDARLSEQVAGLSDSTGKSASQLASLQKEINALSRSQLSREQLDLELLKVKKAYQLTLESEMSRIRRELNSLSETVDRMQSRLTSRSGSSTVVPGGAAASQPKGSTAIREHSLP